MSRQLPFNSATARAPATGRIPELDALRGIAAAAVMLFHFTIWLGDVPNPAGGQVYPFWNGYYGVELFFTISGFVVFWSVERARSAADFAVSRCIRLFPAYWACTTITFVFSRLVHVNDDTPYRTVSEYLVNLTMLEGFLGVRFMAGPYWTLGYEVAFYGLVGLAVHGLGRRVRIEWCCLAWMAAAFAVRLSGVEVPWWLQLMTVLRYGQFFVLGICLFRLVDRRADALSWATLGAALGMALLGQPADESPAGPASKYFPVALGCAGLVWLAVRFRPAALRLPPLLWLGRISYPLYLIHWMIGQVAIGRAMAAGLPAWPAIGVGVAVSLGLAAAVEAGIEAPAMGWLRARYRALRQPVPVARQPA